MTETVDAAQNAEELPRFSRAVVLIGGVVFVALMAVSPRYGFHRDELYFLDAGRHLQGGYVDQPILAPLLARISLDLFGVSLPGLLIWPALTAWATVVVAALIAREYGGEGRAQWLAALGAATMPVLLGVDHLEGPTAYDVLAWAGLAFIVFRIARTGDHRWWLVAGVILGLGLTNKHSIGLFAIAITAGVIFSGGAREVANRWFVGGALIAVVFALPDLVWQAQHGWATIAMTRQLNAENGGLGNIVTWAFGRLVEVSIVLIGVWLAGLRELWRSPRPLLKALAWAYGILFVLFAVTTGAKTYYLAGAYVYLLAVGAVRFDTSLRLHPGRFRALLAGLAVSTAVVLPIVLPLLPADQIAWTYKSNPALGESIGWPQFVRQVRTAWLAIPPAQRAHAVIFAADYGEAGAINELGRGTGLPTAVSGQNSYWWWGYGDPDATTVLAIAPGPIDVTGYDTYLDGFFDHVKTIATITNSEGIHNQEWGGHLYLCTDPKHPWPQMWPHLRHYD
jgi:Dolichyl-phosphate-mannose-protein mannosyltransferase